ncbi:juvenile hormone esterase-like [Sitodiplosis mosellana]|uniref:juvenile hormone esterase-like n=1 Tax=Sitodiplosis mosellana TaxID=263140 RepID=UPI002443D9AA|nr:juvenile hormone esterase-like [Sitodiplosis mosellana]
MPNINSVLILHLLVCLASSLFAQVPHRASQLDCPVIETTLGNIAGIRQQTVLGNSSFCSYRGIRYAVAPVGKLRFKAPIPSGSWEGTYNATEYGSACMQFNFSNLTTSEDCLFLNVFVPEPSICSSSRDIAVIVFIHGGGFITGAAYDGPHLLLNECVILVTLQYRLAIFGFLPLALPEYSGNMGLKDQQLALEWINQHISAFGGNPKQVTLMGQSAGGASVSFQRLNPKSRSYFKRAYVMSSSALSYYALSESNNKTDSIVELAKNQSIAIENSEQLIEYLQTVKADYIISHTLFNIQWQPCVEPKTTINPFITEDPETLLSKEMNLPPTIYTYTSMEGISFALEQIANPDKISYLDTNFKFNLPFHGLDQEACKKEIAPIFTKIRRFYFGHAKINASQILPFVQLTSSRDVAYSIQREVAIQALSASEAKLRVLRVNLRTLLCPSLNLPGVAALAGTSHTDDICSYVWCASLSHIYKEIEAEETLLQQATVRTSKILREILINFAITGNPVSETASFYSFPPVNSKPLTDLPFTELLSVNTLASGSNPDHEEFKFWWSINEKVENIKKMSCNQK